MEKLLSIIIPTYNMEKYLRKCLDSLIVSDENMQFLEVLVINDGSKDSSSTIAHEYEAKFPQTFRVIDKENGNYGSCINRGLKEMFGKYVKVLDADDYFINDTFDKFINFLKTKDDELIINDYSIVNENDVVWETYSFDLPINKNFGLTDIPAGAIEWLWHHGITYKAAIFQSLNYRQTEGISYTDDEWIFKPMVAVNTVAYFPFVMYHYLMGREGQTFDPKIMKASFDKRIIVGKSMALFYESEFNKCSVAAKYYMDAKLQDRLFVIYAFFLIKEFSKSSISMIVEFDDFLKTKAPHVYQLLETFKTSLRGDNIITIWRKAGHKRTLGLLMRQMKFKLRLALGREYRNLHMPETLKRKS